MSALKQITGVAAGVLFAAATALAQTPPAGQQPAAPSQPAPAAQQPAAPAQTPAAPAPRPPQPFPEGAKIAYVNIQAIASNSAEGKAARTKIDDLTRQKQTELGEKNKQLQALQTKLQQGGTVLNDSARSGLEKDIEKLQREIQFFQQDAQSEIQDLTGKLQTDFQDKLNPVLEQVSKEKGLLMLFDVQNSGAVWADGGLDLTAAVIKRFDAAHPGTAAAPAAPKK
jgi:outer membrane protein